MEEHAASVVQEAAPGCYGVLLIGCQGTARVSVQLLS